MTFKVKEQAYSDNSRVNEVVAKLEAKEDELRTLNAQRLALKKSIAGLLALRDMLKEDGSLEPD